MTNKSSVTQVMVDFVMARLAKAHEVIPIVGAATTDRKFVMYLCH